jgi:hypothetical protein
LNGLLGSLRFRRLVFFLQRLERNASRMLRNHLFMLVTLLATACTGAPQHAGSAMLNFQPPPPTYVAQLDFDLMESSRGTACAKVTGDSFTTSKTKDVVVYWTELPLATVAPPPVRGLIAAAALNAIEKTPNADTMIITRVVTEPKGNDTTCAYVYGRGIRLKKAGSSAHQEVEKPDSVPDDENDSGDERK